LHDAPKPPTGVKAGFAFRCDGSVAKERRKPSEAQAGAGATVFEMASFTNAGLDPDAAFAKGLGRDFQVRR
jgi:hypothetical protein